MKKILLRSSDDRTFELEEAVALQMLTLKPMLEDNRAVQEIPLATNVRSLVLSKVIEYCRKHVDDGESEEDSEEELYSPNLSSKELRKLNEYAKMHSRKYKLKSWDTDFVKVDLSTLLDLMLAAKYLNIKSLLDLTSKAVHVMIKGKTPREIRETFNIKREFSPEEEEEIRREYPWVFGI